MLLLLSALAVLASAPSDTAIVLMKEVVVTGVRTPESMLRVPASISVVNRDRFEFSRAISLEDALEFVPGVLAQSRSGGQDLRITIRGFGARGSGERSNTAILRGIRVLTDGIPVTEPDGRTAPDLADLSLASRVEVSRSDVSALYGNAAGGVIHLRTNLDFDRMYAEYRQSAGSFGFHREQGVVGFAAGSGRGMLGIGNTTLEGWRKHSESIGTRAQARFSAPLDDNTRLGILLDAVSTLNRFPGPLTAQQLDSLPEQANPTFVTRDDRRFNRIGRVGLTLDRRIGTSQDLWLSTFIEPKVLQRSERNRFRDFNRYHVGGSAVYQVRTQPSATLESRTSLGGDDAYQDGSIQFHDLTPSGARGITLIDNKREGANSGGAFVQQELIWNQHWSARAALRYDNLWYISENFLEPNLSATRHFNRVTPKGSLAYVGETWTVFASLGGGVEAPAFNEIDPPAPYDTITSFNPFLEPMRAKTYELGTRGATELPGALGTLRYDVALYWIDVTNDIVPWNGGAFFFTAGKSRRKGAELGLGWTPWSKVEINGSATISDNEYVEYVNNLGDFGGNRVAGLPNSAVNAGLRVRPGAGVTAEVKVTSVGRYFADDANTAPVMPSLLVGGSLGIVRPLGIGQLRAFIAGDNLGDRPNIASAFINGVNGQFYEPGMPRNWSAGLTLRWR